MRFDYTNKHKQNKKEESKKENEEEIEINDIDISKEVEKVKKPEEEKVEEPEEKVEEPEEKVEEPEEKIELERYGQIINCELLNGRKEPKSDSEVLLILKKEDNIKILEELDEFYKVLTNNKEVYCMKKFIEIK